MAEIPSSESQKRRSLAIDVIKLLRRSMRPEPVSSGARSIAVLPATPGLADFAQQVVKMLEHFETVRLLTSSNLSEVVKTEFELEMVVDAYDFVDWLE